MLDRLEVRRRALRAAAAAAGLSALSCSDPAASGGQTAADGQAAATDTALDTGGTAGTDTVAADAAATDAAASDAAATDADTAATDTAVADATATDTAVADGAATDAAATDTASTDDVATDAGATDVADAEPCPELKAGEPDCVSLQGTAEWATCCDDRNKWCAAEYPNDTEAQNVCNFGHNYSGQCTGCIPWGPPAPPRFDPAWRPRVVPNGLVFEVV
ncbi:MAG: hypothetical protein RIT45_4359 [Pseudomonadota bacterium]